MAIALVALRTSWRVLIGGVAVSQWADHADRPSPKACVYNLCV